ncbi:hypothetical protein DTO021D3_2658 [Paecilomyces variotii]|nr:hypothetical protein DTO032I3_4532 [Paecilomyces variotii]KAJ9245504.1 hypothetical protein DTO169E5_809 [Paecilomyces variotii]KAJ9280438.1 hypothetical protein DTO021D3_2658 [Paecilomyces variotii]KAJ9346925.1 hypothetical protein DTO027B6_492 [Paecilomyces variotii]KAJ9393510.1 hypothetical protein DTO032I4_281 [Paecilomyces variotii]
MMRANDPRIRQTINQISQNIESANETAQESVYTFTQNYLSPCFSAIGNCLHTCTAPCFPSREDQLRRRRRGRAELNFDFYDDWDNDDAGDALLGWGNDELDRLLAGSGSGRGSAEQPRRQRTMSYGARRTRRRSTVLPDERSDPTVIPKSSFLGFLERFPWKIGARGIKYRPSAADLQENPGGLRRHIHEDEPLMEAAEENEDGLDRGKQTRQRSGTHSSRETTNSLSSRGDLIPSDEEEDAVPLDDEFALALGRRGTGLSLEEPFGKPSFSRRSTGTHTSKDSRRKSKSDSRGRSSLKSDYEVVYDGDVPAMVDLKKEEEQARLEEEAEIARKRLAAHKLAISRGLEHTEDDSTPSMPPSRSSTTSNIGRASLTVDEATTQGDTAVASILNSPGEQTAANELHTEPFPPLSPSSPGAAYMQEMAPSATEVDEPKPVEQKQRSNSDIDES